MNRVLLGIILLGLVVRIGLFLAVPAAAVQTWEYEEIADNILKGHGYQTFHLNAIHHSQGPPLYSFLCVVIYWFTHHSHTAVQLFQIILSCGIAVVVYKIARLFFDENTSLLGAIVSILHPGLVMYSVTKLHPLTLDTLLLLSVVYCFLRFRSAVSPMWGAWSGVLAGLAVLTRPTIAVFLPVGILWIGALKNIDRKKVVLSCCVLVAVAAAVIAPWIVRNYGVYKQFVFITTDTGELLWRGNNPGASGSAYLPSGELVVDKMPDALAQEVFASGELEQDQIFKREAIAFITSNPRAAAKLFLKKFFYFWWFSPQSGILYPGLWAVFYKMYYTILILLAVAGIVMAFPGLTYPRRYEYLLVFSAMLTIAIAQSIYYVEGRHRWTIEPLIIIFAANGFFTALRSITRVKACDGKYGENTT